MENIIKIELTQKDVILLKSLRKIVSDDDLLDLDSYDSISRSNDISNAWEALKVLDRILTPLSIISAS